MRVYDLARDRLDPKPIVDPREEPDEMNGFPLSRVMSRDGRWAYTLYQGTEGKPFIHALDTRDRKAVCIDLDDPALAGGNPYDLRLLAAARGTRLDVRRKGALLATVDTATFRVLSGPAAVRAARADADSAAAGNGAGPSMLWPAIGVALLAPRAAAALRGAARPRCGILAPWPRRCSSSRAVSPRSWRWRPRTTRAASPIPSSTTRSRTRISIRSTSSGWPPTGRR